MGSEIEAPRTQRGWFDSRPTRSFAARLAWSLGPAVVGAVIVGLFVLARRDSTSAALLFASVSLVAVTIARLAWTKGVPIARPAWAPDARRRAIARNLAAALAMVLAGLCLAVYLVAYA